MPSEIYYNADFDLSLRARPLSLETRRVQTRVRALTLHGILGASSEDSVILRTGVPREFLAYLEERGLETPSVVPRPGSREDSLLLPLGWNAETIAMAEDRPIPVPRPDLEVVRRVNSRIFAHGLERDLSLSRSAGVAIRSLREAEEHLGGEAPRERGWVAKADHGNAGMGNRRIRQEQPDDADRRFLESSLAEDDWVILEPWRDRIVDLCTVLEIARDGSVESLGIHEAIHTAEGGFIGVLFHPDSAFAEPWVKSLVETAEAVAQRLHLEGYFGPLAMDSFVFRDGDRQELRPIVDLNCRRPASFNASRWLSRLSGRPVLLWRFLNRRRFNLPKSYEEWGQKLAHREFSSSTERGILLASPLSIRLDDANIPSPKIGVAIVGDSRDDVAEHELWLRDRFER